MTIILAGSSLADLSNSTGMVPENSSDSAAYDLVEGVSSRSNTAFGDLLLGASYSELWFGIMLRDQQPSSTTTFGQMLQFIDSASGQALFDISRVTANTPWVMRYWDGAAWQVGATLASTVFGSTARFDVHVKVDDTTGVFALYKDGALVGQINTTDTLRTAATGIDTVRLGGFGSSNIIGATYYNWFASNEDTRTKVCIGLMPSANGAVSNWAGTYTNIRENGFNDSTVVSAAALDVTSTYVFGTVPTKYQGSPIHAIFLAGRGQGGSDSPTKFDGVTRVGTTLYPTTDLRTQGIGYLPFRFRWEVNPATGLPWTTAEYATTQFGFKSIP